MKVNQTVARDAYADIADRYDRFERADDAMAPFFRRLFDAHRVRRVLDCACGTGRDLVLFHALGREVVGTDLSEAMLAQARRRLAETSLAIELRRADYRELPSQLSVPFDAVTCLSTSIAHMRNEAEVIRAFRSMRDVLRDDGVLVLSQGTTDAQWREQPRFLLAANTPEVSRLFVIDYHGRGATYHVVDICRGGADEGLRVWSVAYALMLLRDDQERLLREAGFRSVEFFGSYRGEQYDKNTSRRLIAVARK